MKIKYLAIFLVLLCCLMGAASAADDVSLDAVDASVDDAITVDAAIDDTEDSTIVEETPVETVADDTTTEEINEEIQTDEISEESADADSEPTRTTITNWTDLKTACGQNSAQTIDLSGVITATDSITIRNSVTITGSSSSYITGGSSSYAPFVCTKSSLTTTFKNIQFKNMNVLHLCQFSGTNIFENCTFTNITTGTEKNSVLYNTFGFMNVTGCNFTNCTTGYGTITNYFFNPSSVTMSVSNCKFENNTASSEPGAINNCGILNVTNSEFNYNSAALWAGAIHTHSNAKTIIKNSSFKGNLAGWNGGALYTYSTLLVYNSTFEDNNCTTDSGGGAIGAYSYGSTYNVTIDSCNFTNNRNLATNGRGGAIGTLNEGNLTVCYSNFINNHADIGQAIAAVTYTIPYCINCTYCNCTNCPNCTNCSHNVSNGTPHLQIFNNTFTNHTGSGDTVVISGNDYLFENNTFVNSVQNTHYGDNNDYGSKAALNMDMSQALKNNLKSSNPLDDEGYQIMYANNNEELQQAFSSCCGANTKIYISDGTYDVLSYLNPLPGVNVIIIGQSMGNTILTSFASELITDETGTLTLINLTFNEIETNVESDFINCTFLGVGTISKQITDEYFYPEYGNMWDPSLDNYGMKKTYLSNFENCIFKNINTEDPAYSIYKFGLAKFTNCTFENITADSIIYKSGEYYDEDGIYFTDCIFKNIDVKGIVDFPAGTVIGTDEDSRLRIEGSTFDFAASTDVVTEGEHNYINTTQDRETTNLTMDIDGDNLVISLKDSEGNPIADVDEINVLVNEESIPCQMENGVATLNISDLSGKVTFSATFEGNSNFKESSASLSTVLVINNVTVEVPVEVPVYITVNQTATSITASDLTATAKVAKTLSVTLKDVNGKVLANKAIKVTVNGKTSTVTTDKNGVAKVTVNYAKAGTYYYTLSFLGDNDYKASMKAVKVTVNKQATKATFAKKTFKVKATKKLTFTLKDAKGKAIKGKKITFTVNKKTYTAKTNAKGIATVKVKLTKKGKYTAVAKFAGDTTYKAISKKAVITIK